MTTASHDAYLETQVLTATPQRLRLMLIEAALRATQKAQAAWRENSPAAGDEAAVRCREILCELIGGIHAGETSTADRVLGIYLFLFSSLTTAQATRDWHRLGGILQVLEEEQETWREVCQRTPERQFASSTAASGEELAPSRVANDFSFAPHTPHALHLQPASQFSIDA